MKNLIQITKEYQCTNNLHREIQARAKSIDRLIVESKDIASVIVNFKTAIAKANNNHPRCHPVELKVHNGTFSAEAKDYILEVENVVFISIWASKGKLEL